MNRLHYFSYNVIVIGFFFLSHVHHIIHYHPHLLQYYNHIQSKEAGIRTLVALDDQGGELINQFLLLSSLLHDICVILKNTNSLSLSLSLTHIYTYIHITDTFKHTHVLYWLYKSARALFTLYVYLFLFLNVSKQT